LTGEAEGSVKIYFGAGDTCECLATAPHSALVVFYQADVKLYGKTIPKTMATIQPLPIDQHKAHTQNLNKKHHLPGLRNNAKCRNLYVGRFSAQANHQRMFQTISQRRS
jgi:hypothetical protein